MTPEQLANSGTEHGHQAAIFCWSQQNERWYPELKWLFAIPNAGGRGSDATGRKILGAKMKAEGVKPGVADLMLPCSRGGFLGLFIELKKTGGTASSEQLDFGAAMLAAGYCWKLCVGYEQARDTLIAYLTNQLTIS